jgi:acyl-coenzyme A synthetase/AMP-(fatty) acid ligase
MHGQRIELEEITGELMKCEGINEAATIAVRPEAGTMELRAFLVAKPGYTLDVQAIKAQITKNTAAAYGSVDHNRAGAHAAHRNR